MVTFMRSETRGLTIFCARMFLIFLGTVPSKTLSQTDEFLGLLRKPSTSFFPSYPEDYFSLLQTFARLMLCC